MHRSTPRTFPRSAFLSLFLLVVIGTVRAGQGFEVSILSSSGSVQSRFQATLPDMHVSHVKIGPDGNIWLARSDNSHGFGSPNPNDMVAVFDFSGTELRTVSGGGMRDPTSVGFDSAGSIYVPGQDMFFATDVYKYDSSGSFLGKFHTSGWTLIDVYNDIETVTGDRIYVSAWWGTGSADQMTEFDAAGNTANTFSPTGPTYFHRDVALSPTSTVWVRTPKNGPGDDLIREFDLAGNQTRSFSTTAALPGAFLVGLQVKANGNLLTLDTVSHNLYELMPTGTVVGSVALQGLSSWITDFTVAADGRILVSHVAEACSGPAQASTYGSGWPGTNGEPQLSSSNPSLCSDLFLDLSNSLGAPTLAVLFAGLQKASLPTTWGGTLLVLPSWVLPVPLASFGFSVSIGVPCDPVFCGLEVDLQALEADPGASKGVSFTAGLDLDLGN